MVQLISLAQKLFRTQKVNMFITDIDLSNKLLSFGERKHNYKKLSLDSTIAVAVFTSEQNFMQPLFYDISEVTPIINSKQILVPLVDPTNPRHTQMVLQIVGDEKELKIKGNMHASQT